MAGPKDVAPRFDGPAIGLEGVAIHRRTVPLVQDIDWIVEYGQHWVIFGRNGAGKTTVVRVGSGTTFPSRGRATVLGHRMGTVDLRTLRRHIGLVTTKQRLPDEESYTAATVVLTGHTGSVLPLWEYYDEQVVERARHWLDFVGCSYLADRSIRACSQGERARVRLARALIAEPTLLILDEPFAGLDMPARDDLVQALEALQARERMTTVLVTHHVEEIPPSTTHALFLKDGGVSAAGPMDSVFTARSLGDCLGREVELARVGRRWSAHVSDGLSTVGASGGSARGRIGSRP